VPWITTTVSRDTAAVDRGGMGYRPLRPIEGVIFFCLFLTRFVFYVSFVMPSGVCVVWVCVAILEGIGPITELGTIYTLQQRQCAARRISHIQFLCSESKNKKGLSRMWQGIGKRWLRNGFSFVPRRHRAAAVKSWVRHISLHIHTIPMYNVFQKIV